MQLYIQNENYKLYQGNMLDMLDVIEPNTIDSIVTDPPYELNFMSKGWDNAGVSFNSDTWKKCYEVLKPGGYLLAFGGSRTFHRIACAIEDAGFEIRDTIIWLYGSGFPKSMSLGKVIEGKLVLGSANVRDIKKLDGNKTNVTCGFNKTGKEQKYRDKEYEMTKTEVNYTTDLAKQWQGWGTCLKPSFEPIIVARKPFKGSLVDNIIENGVGGINIDECRVGNEERTQFSDRSESKTTVYNSYNQENAHYETVVGRFPANTILDSQDGEEWRRYFYCAKASKKDRDEGLDGFDNETVNDGRQTPIDNPFQRGETPRKNTHPTVKPTDLMQYLVRLITPNNGTVLDPFNGSGSTGKAVMYENKERNKGYKYIGIELTEEYLPIAKARIEYVGGIKNELY